MSSDDTLSELLGVVAGLLVDEVVGEGEGDGSCKAVGVGVGDGDEDDARSHPN